MSKRRRAIDRELWDAITTARDIAGLSHYDTRTGILLPKTEDVFAVLRAGCSVTIVDHLHARTSGTFDMGTYPRLTP